MSTKQHTLPPQMSKISETVALSRPALAPLPPLETAIDNRIRTISSSQNTAQHDGLGFQSSVSSFSPRCGRKWLRLDFQVQMQAAALRYRDPGPGPGRNRSHLPYPYWCPYSSEPRWIVGSDGYWRGLRLLGGFEVCDERTDGLEGKTRARDMRR